MIAFAALLLAGCMVFPDASHKDALLVRGKWADAPGRVRDLRDQLRADLPSIAKEYKKSDKSVVAACYAMAYVEPRERVILVGSLAGEEEPGIRTERGGMTIGYSEETAATAVSATVVIYLGVEEEPKNVEALPVWYVYKDGHWRNQWEFAIRDDIEKYPSTLPFLTTMPATRESAEP